MRRPRGQRHIALCDVHVPHQVKLEPVFDFIKRYEPTHIIINGDFFNLEYASHWNEAVFAQVGFTTIAKNLEKEFRAGRNVIAQIRQLAPNAKLFFVPGNHEAWLLKMALKHPGVGLWVPKALRELHFKSDIERASQKALSQMLASSEILDAERFGMDVLRYRKELKLGKISYFHGDQFKDYRGTTRIFPTKNIVFGHFHTHHVETLHNSGELGRDVQHVAVPCLTNRDHGYLKTRSTTWLNGFWAADVAPSGLFDGRVVKLLNGKVLVPA